jgi:hypothetical protein
MSETTQKNIKDIYDSIITYISINATFESNEAIKDVVNKINISTSMDDIFKMPIKYRLFNFKGALEWLYFICFIIHIINDENIIIPYNFNIEFLTNDAIIYISTIYDAANEIFYQDYINKSNKD